MTLGSVPSPCHTMREMWQDASVEFMSYCLFLCRLCYLLVTLCNKKLWLLRTGFPCTRMKSSLDLFYWFRTPFQLLRSPGCGSLQQEIYSGDVTYTSVTYYTALVRLNGFICHIHLINNKFSIYHPGP